MTHPITPPDRPMATRALPDLWELLHQSLGSAMPQDVLSHLLDRLEARP